MADRDWVLSVDVGTSSVKAAVFDAEARLAGECSQGYGLIQPKVGWLEQDPKAIQDAIRKAIRGVLGTVTEKPAVLVFSTAMHALMGVDASDTPLTHFVTWGDQRAEAIAKALRAEDQGLEIYRKTGTPIHAMSPLVKLAWFKTFEPELFERVHRWVDLKAWVLHIFTGKWVVDESLASATGLYNLFTRDWDEEALAWCGVRDEQLPQLVETTAMVGAVQADLARDLGLPLKTQVIAGASDGALANLGVGAVRAGSLALSIGTSGAVRAMVNQPELDPEGRLFCYVVDKAHYIVGGPINNGGILLRWLQNVFFMEDQESLPVDALFSPRFYSVMNREVASVPAGSEGLFCMPYLTGERAPLWREEVSGGFLGLRFGHTRGHMMRAVLEGICYQLHSVVELLVRLNGPAKEIRATGGFTQSEIWVKILTDILGMPLGIPEHTQGSALGGAFLAWCALGQIPSLDVCADWISLSHQQRPDEADRLRYQDGFQLFKELVATVQPQFPKLHAFTFEGEQ